VGMDTKTIVQRGLYFEELQLDVSGSRRAVKPR
jgi:hypothetical protein